MTLWSVEKRIFATSQVHVPYATARDLHFQKMNHRAIRFMIASEAKITICNTPTCYAVMVES